MAFVLLDPAFDQAPIPRTVSSPTLPTKSTPDLPLRTLIPEQRRDPEEPDDRVPRVWQPEPDYQQPWRPETKSGGHAVELPSPGSSANGNEHEKGEALPKMKYRFHSFSRPNEGYVYETAAITLRDRPVTVPSSLAVARAKAIETGSVEGGSTLVQYLSGLTLRPTAEEKRARGMVRAGAMEAQEAPVESRRKREAPSTKDEREKMVRERQQREEQECLEALMRVRDTSVSSSEPLLSMPPPTPPASGIEEGKVRVHRPAKLRIRRDLKSFPASAREEALISGALPASFSAGAGSRDSAADSGLPPSLSSTLSPPSSMGTSLRRFKKPMRDLTPSSAATNTTPQTFHIVPTFSTPLEQHPRPQFFAQQVPEPTCASKAEVLRDAAGPMVLAEEAGDVEAAERMSVTSKSVRRVVSGAKGRLAAGAGMVFRRVEERIWGEREEGQDEEWPY